MSESSEESVVMPGTVPTKTISDMSPDAALEDNKRRSSSPEEALNKEEKSSNSPSAQISMPGTNPSTVEDATSTPETDISTSLQAAPSLGIEPETPTPLPKTLTTNTDSEIHTSLPSAPTHKAEPEAPIPLPSALVPQSETLTSTSDAPPSRRVSFPADHNNQVHHLSPTGSDKEPCKDPHVGLPPGHRMSFIDIPGRIGDTPATSLATHVKLWVVVIVTLALCVGLMVAAHLTHSLTLRVEAYHSLYNAGALAGSLLSIKLCRQPESLLNTFGWARIDVVSYLISLIFLSSLCFSVAVEAVQTAAHVQHQDPMHYPMATILVAVAALGVNALVFALIGGYTQHQGSFMEVRGSGEVFVKKQVRQDSLQTGQKTLSSRRSTCPGPSTLREGYKDILRDIAGLLLTIACATVVLQTEGSLLSFYIDPAVAMVSVSVLSWLSYPFAKECSNILLQTIPQHIDVERFSERLQESFPAILNVHHLHIWSLRPGKVVSTIHVVFAGKDVYRKISSSLTTFFKKEGISLVTLQPEFMKAGDTNKAKCCCSDHLLDGAGDSCDDHAWQPADDHDQHDHKGHDHKHDHHHHQNGHSHEHDHKQKQGHAASDHEHLHKHGQKQTPGEDLAPRNPLTLCDEKTNNESNVDHSMTLNEHSKLHENQVHQHPDATKVDLSVIHERGTRQVPDHSNCSQACTQHEEISVSEDGISTSSRISQNSKVECTNEKVASCGVSLESDPSEADPCSVSLDELKIAKELLRKRSGDDEPEPKSVVVCKVGILSEEEDGILDCIVSDKLNTKQVLPLEALNSSSETLNSTIMENSTKSNSSCVVVEKTSSIQDDVSSCITGSIENKSLSETRVVDKLQETSNVDNLLNVPKIEITLRELVVSDEEGNLLFSDMRYASGCPDVEVIGSPSILRKASSESYLLVNSIESAEIETKPRSDSTLSADENSAMLGPAVQLTKDGNNFSLTRSVEKLSGPESDHSM